MAKVVCPFCYEEYPARDVRYRCISPRCSGKNEEDKEYSTYMGLSGKACAHGGHVFQGPEDGLLGKAARAFRSLGFGRVPGVPLRPTCPECHGNQVVETCPVCHNPLPESSIEGENHTIAVIGTTGSGKTHYIATVINELQTRVGCAFGASVLPFTSFGSPGYSCDALYRETKYNPLYGGLETLGRTDGVGGVGQRDHDKIPLVYIWNYMQGELGRKKAFTLSFIDVAGENCRDNEVMAEAMKYICRARGIILLVDPLNIPAARAQIELASGQAAQGSYDSQAGGAQTALSNAVQFIQSSRGMRPGDKLDIPVAVTFTKFDSLLPAVPNVACVRAPSPHCSDGVFHESDRLAVDGEIRTLLENWGERSLIVDAESAFTEVGFFGVSALGIGNAPKGRSVNTPHPHRVEDPLLWIMSRQHLVRCE